MLVPLLLPLLCLGPGAANEGGKRLFEDLFSTYNRLVRPVENPLDRVSVKFQLKLSQLLDVYEKDQIMVTALWLYHEWYDEKLRWDPAEYNGVTNLYVPSDMIWIPDTVLYNNADGNYQIMIMTKANVSFDGKIRWQPPGIYKSMCEIDVEWFPFDQQECKMKFGLWAYSYDEVDMLHNFDNEFILNRTDHMPDGTEVEVQKVDLAIDIGEYGDSVEWAIMDAPGERHVVTYPGLPSPFVDITYKLVLRRKPLFYSTNLLAPSVSISFLSILVFYLPTDSGEKITLCISVLIALSIFFILLIEIIPATSLVIPLIGRYLLFTMILVTLSIIITVITINVHYRSPTTHTMPGWVRKVFIEFLPKRLGMQRSPPTKLSQKFRDLGKQSPRNKLKRTLDTIETCLNIELDDPYEEDAWEPSGIDMSSYPSLRSSIYPAVYTIPQPKPRGIRREVYGQSKPNFGTEQEDALRALLGDSTFNKLLNDIIYIGNHMVDSYTEQEEEDDWRYVAMVIDRLFLWIYMIVTTVSTIAIIANAPSLYDKKKPIA